MMSDRIMTGAEEAAIAAFIRTRGVTRCPTACVTTTQATVTAADRAALERYVRAREQLRRARAAASERQLFGPAAPVAVEH
jgi:citrate lyase gamma subunit